MAVVGKQQPLENVHSEQGLDALACDTMLKRPEQGRCLAQAGNRRTEGKLRWEESNGEAGAREITGASPMGLSYYRRKAEATS